MTQLQAQVALAVIGAMIGWAIFLARGDQEYARKTGSREADQPLLSLWWFLLPACMIAPLAISAFVTAILG